MFSPVVSCIANFLEYVLWFIALSFLLNSRYSTFVSSIIVVLSYVLYYPVLSLFPPLSMLRAITGPLIFVLTVLLLFRNIWYEKVLCAFGVLATMMVSELFVLVLNRQNFQLEGIEYSPIPVQINAFLMHILTNALLLFVLVIIAKRWLVKDIQLLDQTSMLAFLSILVTQFVLLYCIFKNVLNDDRPEATLRFVFLAVLCVLSDAVTIYIIRKSILNSKLRLHNEMLQTMVDAQSEYYASQAALYEDIRKIRHDISNHLYTVKILLDENKPKEASEYANEMRTYFDSSTSTIQCPNTLVAAFLQHRIAEMEKDGIQVCSNVQVPAEIKILKTDLISSFGNLLDNAEEACKASDSKRISINTHYKKPYLYIEINNPYVSVGSEKKRRIPELGRGIGFIILDDIANRYDGSFTHSVSDGVFYSSLVLKEMSVLA